MRMHVAIGALVVGGAAALAAADLTGTLFNQFTLHTGPFGQLIGGEMEYGTTETYQDPIFPQFTYDAITPGNVPGFDNSIEYDFTSFAYTDFAPDTGSVMMDSLAEDVEPGSVRIFGDDATTEIGFNYADDADELSGDWLVADALQFDPAGGAVSVFVAWNSAGSGKCIADCNGDGNLNILDFVCFQMEFQNQSDLGDCDGNGAYNILDFVCFQQEFQAGCP